MGLTQCGAKSWVSRRVIVGALLFCVVLLLLLLPRLVPCWLVPFLHVGPIAVFHSHDSHYSHRLEVGGVGVCWLEYQTYLDRNTDEDAVTLGLVTQHGGHLTFWRDLRLSDYYDHGAPTALDVVSWGERRYLVPPGSLRYFCAAVNRGYEPRSSRFAPTAAYLPSGDWEKPVTGPPTLPADLAKLIALKPITAKAFAVIGTGSAIVDVGTRNGICEGMEMFNLSVPAGTFDLYTVQEASATTATVSLAAVPPFSQVWAGNSFSTRPVPGCGNH